MKIVVLAGGKVDETLRAQTGVEWRSELPYKGKGLLDHVLDALRPMGEVVVVGGPQRDDVTWTPGGDRFFDSFARGVAMGGEGQFLMASADIPFLTQEAVEDFIEHSRAFGATLSYPIVRVKDMEARFGGMARTSLKLKEGEFTGGNLFLVEGDMMRAVMPKMEAAYAARKNVLKLGQLLGLPTLAAILATKLLPGSVSVNRLETCIGKALGAPVKAIISEHPEIAADIDSSEHFAWLQTL